MDIYVAARQATVINEEPIGSLLRKQDSITRLFPPFYDRVDKVAAAGGVRLVGEKPGLWHFKVASATTPGAKYDNYVQFADIQKVISDQVHDMSNWNKDKTAVDLRKLGAAVVDKADLHISCNCKAFQYWGPAYITTKRGTKYGEPENRPPRERNPREYGLMCKHAQLVFDVIPFYKSTMAGHIKRFFMKDVQAAAEDMLKQKSAFKKGAEFLKGKQKESVDEPLNYVDKNIELVRDLKYMTFTMPKGSLGKVTDGDGSMLEVKFEKHDSVLEVPPDAVKIREDRNI